MKRRFSGSDGDSLELLLDTLCNVFGGVVLIACLLAIIPRSSSPPPLLPIELASAEMTERRILAAKLELDRLDAKVNEMGDSVDPAEAKLQMRLKSLEATLADLKSKRAVGEEQELSQANARALATQVDPKDLADKLDKLKSQISSAENLSRAGLSKIDFLEKRMKILSEESEKLSVSKVQAVRFPRERAKTTSPFPIIVKYGKVYPLDVGNPLRNNDAIHKEIYSNGDGFIAEPLRDKGIELPQSKAVLLATLKAAAVDGVYVSIYLYPDSYEVFQDLKNSIFEVGLTYGLDFMESGNPIGFSSKGKSLPGL